MALESNLEIRITLAFSYFPCEGSFQGHQQCFQEQTYVLYYRGIFVSHQPYHHCPSYKHHSNLVFSFGVFQFALQ